MLFQPQTIVIDHFCRELEASYALCYGKTSIPYDEIAVWAAHLALENIANSSSLYHNSEHTMLVTAVGQSILQGKHLLEGGVTPEAWFHFTVATLFHDIGYLRGICRGDNGERCVIDSRGTAVAIPPSGTDAALTPWHVMRSQIFVRERFAHTLDGRIDCERICDYIEMTRFPIPKEERYADSHSYGGLVRAADLIGQLGDPNYLRKVPALFYEFEELGYNRQFGYRTPKEMRDNYGRFYWREISPYIGEALRCLRVTQQGRQWIATLHAHLFDIEHDGAE